MFTQAMRNTVNAAPKQLWYHYDCKIISRPICKEGHIAWR